MEPFSLKANCLGLLIATLLSARAHKKRSLTVAGSSGKSFFHILRNDLPIWTASSLSWFLLAAFCVGFGLVSTGLRGFNIVVFYLLGTKATKYKKALKEKIDGTLSNSAGSIARGPGQVLACSLLAVILSLAHGIMFGAERPINFVNASMESRLTCAVIAHHATCLADTLASELGILSKRDPVLITKPWRNVPPGTNGGVTLMGCFWSALGGFIIGLSTIQLDFLSGLSPLNSSSVIAYSTTCGLVGSLVDSILGATMQQSFFDPDTKKVYQSNDEKPSSTKIVAGMNLLTNEQVNLVSVGITTFLGGYFLAPLFFY
jgi:uncharacterized protein (TIGR00297 family)